MTEQEMVGCGKDWREEWMGGGGGVPQKTEEWGQKTRDE